MDRRLALKQLALITGGAIVIPSCDFSKESALEAYKRLHITPTDRETLTHVVNTIFPGIRLKKADEISLQDFVLVMANDCLPEEEQQSFVTGLKAFPPYSKKEFGSAFSRMDSNESADTFRAILAKDPQENKDLADIQSFLKTTKRFALQGYLTSEYYMTEVMPHKMIPGGFRGSKLVSEIEHINTNG